MTTPAVRTEVAIVGAGPAGLLLSHLLTRFGVDSIVVERRSRAYVEARIRAGILEQSTVDLLDECGLGDRLHREGFEHRGIYLQWSGERHHLDFVDLVGRGVWLYGQTEITRDLGRAHDQVGTPILYEVSDTVIDNPGHGRPSVTCVEQGGRKVTITAEAVVGCDGGLGPGRTSVPEQAKEVWERGYSYSWLGVLAEVAPSTDELIYAWHEDGFALHSMRSPTVSRLYLQVPNQTDIADWPDDRIWDALSKRLAGGPGQSLQAGPIVEKSVLPMRSFVMAPMRYGNLFLAGDAAHTVPPTGAKGLNLAVADVARLAPALTALVKDKDPRPADAYSETALQRVWRATHFSWWMTSLLHRNDDRFDTRLQRSQFDWIVRSGHAAAGLAENYVGLPFGI